MVSFSKIPDQVRVPLFYAEFDNSQANTATATQRTLIIGQMLDSSEQTANVPATASSASTVAGLYGNGSMLHSLITAYLENDTSAIIHVLPLADDATAMTAASGTITVASAASATGVISLYIAGLRVQMTVTSSDTVSEIATALAAKINAKSGIPVTAAAAATVITLTAKNRGAHGNNIDIRQNYQGIAGGESTPSGLSLTIVSMSGGTGSPELDDALANLGDTTYDFIVNPYTDTTSLDAVKSFLDDSTGRWSYNQLLYGHSFGCVSGTYGSLTAIGEARNNPHETLLGVYGSPTPPHVWSAALVGAIAPALRNDPGRPTQTLAIAGVLAPPTESRFQWSERNNLLFSGISTFTVSDDGAVQAENIITTYQYNSYGAEDDSYLQIETLYLLAFVTRYLKTQVTSKFPRMKLAANGTRFASGQAIVTPNIIRSELIAQYTTLENNGYVQDAGGFADGLVVEQDSNNPNRVNVLWDGVLINQLRIFAVLNQFRLQAA
ncbi:phage tail sheath subtilisin-like domain-containing protein [Brenneria populi subsp. brevivirga]|uniref:phage tail sheath subtilisin-like domain-containing protein n=1 Tax=Brenneria populi TaxID=1505588 RepID=UPI002E182504|nr:phage tail sheath subtilisin-like domain-containing protein [Brenneria populi subsp. brevivirga]